MRTGVTGGGMRGSMCCSGTMGRGGRSMSCSGTMGRRGCSMTGGSMTGDSMTGDSTIGSGMAGGCSMGGGGCPFRRRKHGVHSGEDRRRGDFAMRIIVAIDDTRSNTDARMGPGTFASVAKDRLTGQNLGRCGGYLHPSDRLEIVMQRLHNTQVEAMPVGVRISRRP